MKDRMDDFEIEDREVSMGEDIFCELDPTKICDNCFRCLESDADYATVEIDGIYMNGERIY